MEDPNVQLSPAFAPRTYLGIYTRTAALRRLQVPSLAVKRASPLSSSPRELARSPTSEAYTMQAASRSSWRLLYFLHTLYLFTKSDMKTFVLPQMVFGIFSALSGPVLTTDAAPLAAGIVMRIPLVFLWTWLNTLVFDLSNQRRPEAVLEDKLNKPWRPLAAGRISPDATRRLLFVAMPMTLGIVHWCLRGTLETVVLFALNGMYNDLGGSDGHFLIRNFIIAVAYTLYGSVEWLIIIGLTILSTMHIQDLKDMAGDAARNRRTLPLSIGPTPTRYLLAGSIGFWSVACTVYWRLDHRLAAPIVALGGIVAVRLTRLRTVAADTTSWRLWAYWLLSLYVLPWAQSLLDRVYVE